MPSLARAILIFIPAAVLIWLLDTPLVLPVLAKPIHGPPLLRNLNIIEHSGRDFKESTAFRMRSIVAHNTKKSGKPSKLMSRKKVPSGHDRQKANEARLADARQHYANATSYAATYQNLAAQYSATSVQNPQYQPQTAEALSGFSDNVLGFQTALAELGAGHGLANFDKTNDVEILIKNMDNLIKDVLTATVQLVDQLPVIGPVLGPIIYDIKCYIDEILNLVENLTDATINALQPALQASLGSAIMASCRCGVKVLGLCI